MWSRSDKDNTETVFNIWNCRPVQEQKGIKCVIKHMKNNLKGILDQGRTSDEFECHNPARKGC